MADRVELRDLTVDVIVGVLEAEQRSLQPVVIDLDLEVDLDPAASGDLGASVDYGAVRDQVVFLAEHGRFRLIESLAAAIARLLLAPPPPAARAAAVERVVVRIRKPTILGNAVPAIRLERGADWCDLQTRVVPERTWLDTLVDTPQGGAWRAHVEPESAWKVPSGVALLVVAGRVQVAGVELPAGTRIARGQAASIKAVGQLPATLLIVGTPGGGAL